MIGGQLLSEKRVSGSVQVDPQSFLTVVYKFKNFHI